MKRNGWKYKKTKKNAGVFSICHLRVPDFLPKKKIYRSQIGEIQQRKKEPLTLFSGGVKRNCINNCPLTTVHVEFGESRLGTQIGNLKGEGFLCKKLHLKAFILASFWIAEGKQRNEAE